MRESTKVIEEVPGLNVLIVGGGIGGLTAALCLARDGNKVSVFEQSPVFGEVGAGLQLSPNCTRVLHDLGLEQSMLRTAFLPEGTQFKQWDNGKVIGQSMLGASAVARYGYPYYHMHRQDLMKVLVEAVEEDSNIELHTNLQVQGFTQNDQGVSLIVGDTNYPGDLLVGADGIHSVISAGLWGEVKPRFTGNIAWRALVPAERLPTDTILPMSTAWWGPGKHFVHYYVRSGELINCVCVVEKEGWAVESWSERGDYNELKSDFTGWHSDIQQLIDHADRDSLFKWALYDRAPMPRWGKGRVTLLGDASHPTLPFMAQGAAMAIEDAAVLAGCLSDRNDIPQALARYEDLRRDRTAGIQRGSRRNATVFHLSGVKAWLRNRALKTAQNRTMDGLFGYNAFKASGR
ncbi:MAG: FAD-binding protein [Gammaproteobacteria bacterium]|nr:FAD-binding protein [Gammaproteobacteria bacterium]